MCLLAYQQNCSPCGMHSLEPILLIGMRYHFKCLVQLNKGGNLRLWHNPISNPKRHLLLLLWHFQSGLNQLGADSLEGGLTIWPVVMDQSFFTAGNGQGLSCADTGLHFLWGMVGIKTTKSYWPVILVHINNYCSKLMVPTLNTALFHRFERKWYSTGLFHKMVTILYNFMQIILKSIFSVYIANVDSPVKE